MEESLPITAPALPVDPVAGTRSSSETKQHLLAALLSAIVPGAGQLFLGQRRKGTILLLILTAVLIGFWPLRLLRFYAGLVLLFCGWIVLYFYAACSAQLARNAQTGVRPSRWWLVAVLPVTALTLSFLGRGITRASGFRSFSIPSTSMEKTLRQGDVFIVDINYRRAERREVIVFFRDSTYFVKRAIAINGDSIEGRDGTVFVNGNRQDEPYVQHTGGAGQSDWLNNFGPMTIPGGKCFVMGDNRDVSLDSRAANFGLVNDSSIVGKALYVYASGRPGKSVR